MHIEHETCTIRQFTRTLPTCTDTAGTAAASAVSTPVRAVLPACTHTMELKELQCEHSKQIWRNMNIFSSFVGKDDVRRVREEELRQQCKASGGKVKHVAAPKNETAECANKRHNAMHAALQQLKPAAERENARAAKTRLKEKAVHSLESKELGSDELNTFLEHTLGNLPLSVRLCGQILHHMGGGLCGHTHRLVVECVGDAVTDVG